MIVLDAERTDRQIVTKEHFKPSFVLKNNLVLTNAVADSVRKKISTAFKLGKRLVCVLLFKTVISITSLSDIRMYFETVINIRE